MVPEGSNAYSNTPDPDLELETADMDSEMGTHNTSRDQIKK